LDALPAVGSNLPVARFPLDRLSAYVLPDFSVAGIAIILFTSLICIAQNAITFSGLRFTRRAKPFGGLSSLVVNKFKRTQHSAFAERIMRILFTSNLNCALRNDILRLPAFLKWLGSVILISILNFSFQPN
jgi:hypothetical protein